MSHQLVPQQSRSLRSSKLLHTEPVKQHDSSPSHTKLFVTNLRLLDLDLRKDWPSITTQTFTTRNAIQNQKKRIESVEWALFHLFSIWDPKEAQDKLQPFFPPREPLQSLNLRQALYRCLENAKKNGVLGRDTVLRRTMLDECKGERLEEVLSTFSTAVLKKVVKDATPECERTIALRMSLENLSYTGERMVLKVLILTHKSALNTVLARKAHVKHNYDNFAQLLATKKHDIEGRFIELEVRKGDSVEQEICIYEGRRLRDVVHQLWTGDDAWRKIITSGQQNWRNDVLSGCSFEMAERPIAMEASDVKVVDQLNQLDDLNARLMAQKQWLEKWCKFQAVKYPSLVSPTDALKRPSNKRASLDLQFDRHQSLQLGNGSTTEVATPMLYVKHQKLVHAMSADLAAITLPKMNRSVSNRRSFAESRSVKSQMNNIQGSLDEESGNGDHTIHTEEQVRMILSKNDKPESFSFHEEPSIAPALNHNLSASWSSASTLPGDKEAASSPESRHTSNMRLSLVGEHSPYYPRQPSAPFLPSPKEPPTSPESELSRRTRLSIANLSAMTKTADLQRKSSIKKSEKASGKTIRAQFMPQRLSAQYEDGYKEEESRSESLTIAGQDDDVNPFLSRPKVSNN